MKTYPYQRSLFAVTLSLFGCATSTPQEQVSVYAAPKTPVDSMPSPAALPTFADSELAKLPGVQTTMDRCREQNKKHKVTTSVIESGPAKGNLAINISCEE